MVEGRRGKKGIIFNHTSISTELKVLRSSKQDASHKIIKEMCIFFFLLIRIQGTQFEKTKPSKIIVSRIRESCSLRAFF